MDGTHEVNEVFFDNVKVPVENRVGEENKGWTYAKFLLVHERSGIAGVARSKKAIERLKEIAEAETVDGAPLIADRRLLAQGRRPRNRSGRAGIHRTAHAGPGSPGQEGRARKLDPQDQGHRDPAAHHRADGRGDRLLRLSRTTCFFGDNEYPVGPDYAVGASGDILQHAQGLDLWRLQRDPAQHHRQGGVGPVKLKTTLALCGRGSVTIKG